VAANIIDGDGGRISQIQNLVDCIPLQIRRTFSWQIRYLHLAVWRFRTIASLLRPAL
jgi:hypothetical protein